jgi:hypothetical protein
VPLPIFGRLGCGTQGQLVMDLSLTPENAPRECGCISTVRSFAWINESERAPLYFRVRTVWNVETLTSTPPYRGAGRGRVYRRSRPLPRDAIVGESTSSESETVPGHRQRSHLPPSVPVG